MMKFFTRCFAFVCFVAFGASQSFGQDVFFSEDFDGAFPADWTSVVRLGNGQPSEAWFHTTVGATGPFSQTTPALQSTTADNGWMIFDSDLNCNEGVGQDAWLISPAIDASDKEIVFIRFQTFYRRFLDRGNLRVGTDLNNLDSWATIDVFPGLANNAYGGGDATVNPTLKFFNISEWAAGESAFYFAFQFLSTTAVSTSNLIGCAYSWQVDDVELTDQDLTIQNDMRVNSNFFAIAPNAVTPASQVEPFGFIADIQNVGGATQESSTLTLAIENADEEVIFTSTLNYGSIAPDSLAENVFFPDEFTPPAVPDEIYFGTYTLAIDGADDEVPDNNFREFSFVVSDSVFSKELGQGLGGRRASGNLSYSWGNIYYVPNGEGLAANSISFALANADRLPGRSLVTYLYKWNGDTNGDDQINPAEYGQAPVAFNSYEVQGDENGLITVPVDIDGNQIALEDGAHYIAVIQFATEVNDTMFLLSTDRFNYSAMAFYSDSLDRPRYGSAIDSGNSGTYDYVFTVVPVVRLNIGPLVSVQEQPLPAGAVSVFPNPADEQFVLSLNLDSPSSKVEISIMDISGKVLSLGRYQNLYREQLTIPTAKLPSGTYTVKVRTDKGVTTKRLVVQH